jgi:pSer/pThr/pTyr-binding forkhead associated (FHA) protein/tetratricopeptide (TPR) repeat protein
MRFKIVNTNDPNLVFETGQREFALGRSKECEIVIPDPHISRVQARVRFESNRFYIENIGQNPVQINGAPTAGQFLNDGDQITLGTTSFRFQSDRTFDVTPHPIAFDEKTIAVGSLPNHILGPRLVLTTDAGDTQAYPMNKDRLIIGRSEDADIALQDPSISRQHGMIEQREDGYFVKNLSQTNPLLLNDATVSDNRLYSGDHIRVGSFHLTFVSDRPEDAKPIEEKIITQQKGPGWALWLAAACLILIAGSFLLYRHVFYPWKINRNLETIAGQIAAGKYQPAQDALHRLLAKSVPPDSRRRAGELLAQTALAIVQKLAEAGKLPEAEQYLVAYLKEYGGGKEADTLWERLDMFRVEIAQNLETASQYQAALGLYAAVREDSPYYGRAQQGIRRIWLASQQEQRRDQNVAQLLQEADQDFRAKRYLTPVNNNAYSVYQAVLAADPENSIALERIEQMKNFYLRYGEEYFNKNNWRNALTYFERYVFMAPDSPDIQQKIDLCRVKLKASDSNGPQTGAKTSAPEKSREQVKKLLEESGVESSRIIKFLYEDPGGEKDPEKPW